MTGPDRRRPQLAPRGERAVLLVRRDGQDAATRSLAGALDTITAAGYELVAVMDPSDYREAHRMIAEDLADVIVVSRFEHLPSVRRAADQGGRPEPVLRRPVAGTGPTVSDGTPERRTQIIRRGDAEVEVDDSGHVAPTRRKIPADRRRPQRLR